MDNLTVSTVINDDDWRALTRATRQRLWSPDSRVMRLLIRAPFLLLVVLLVGSLLWARNDREVLAFVVGVLGVVLLGAAQSLISLRLAAPKRDGLFFGPTRYLFHAEGIQVDRGDSDTRVRWHRIHAIEDTPTHVFLWIASNAAFVVPARDLSGGLTAPILAARLRTLQSQFGTGNPYPAVDAADFSVPPPPAESLPAPANVSLAQELGAAARQLLLLRADAARLIGSDAAIALAGALALALWLPLDGLLYPGRAEFMLEQSGGLAMVIAGALALAWLLSRLSVPRLEYRRVLLVVVVAMFIAIAGSTAFNYLANNYFAGLAVLLVFTAYAMLYFKRALRTLTGFIQTRALLVAAGAVFCFVLAMDRLYINPSLWIYTGEDDTALEAGEDYEEDWRRVQALQFDQQARLDTQVARIAAHSAPGAQVYFVGFAGHGEQRVFAQEIGLAARRVAERYGAAGREILLVNDRRDFEKYPLATARALRHTLLALGKVMDADDVLFLALSSHGDENATLTVSNAGMMPGELGVDELAAALADSGIRWKVIVISACHAGSFIEKLKGDRTIVLTAAAADRTSFGCSDDRDLTYFGEAFYRDAWKMAGSLRSVFEAAKTSIAQREKAEGVSASEPQGFFGAALEAKLEGPESPAANAMGEKRAGTGP